MWERYRTPIYSGGAAEERGQQKWAGYYIFKERNAAARPDRRGPFFCTLPLRKRRLRALGLASGPLRASGFLLYTVFLAGLFATTLAPFGFWASVWTGAPPRFLAPFSGSVNLIPFQSLEMFLIWAEHRYWNDILINLLGNILIFLPVGFFPALLWRGAVWRRSLLCGLGRSFLY